MKIALIGPGIMSIPPPGWGAVEILIWDYYKEIKEQGHEVDIINPIRKTPNDQSNPYTHYCKQLISYVNAKNYDFVHIHYDCLYHILPFLNCKKAITSHYPYIDQPNNYGGFQTIFQNICQNENHIIFALSKKDYDVFYNHCSNKKNIEMLLNGANESEIVPIPITEKKELVKSIYIGKIEERKQQEKYCSIQGIDFYGKCENKCFRDLDCFKGEVEHSELMKILPNYGNLILLSKGESDALVIKEAIMAGLPVVTNRYCLQNMDDFLMRIIDIIPDDKLNDLHYIEKVIIENREKQSLQNEIREYAVKNFSWKYLVSKYLEKI